MVKSINDLLKLYLIIETPLIKLPIKDFISQCIEAGVTAFQLRDKGVDANIVTEKAFIIKEVIDSYKNHNLLYIINDRVDIAHIVGADGVHLGIKDINPYLVKQHYPKLIIGSSCNNIDDVNNANKYSDYVGIGPAFFTSTKKDLRQVIGLNGISKLVENLNIPSVAIGGINKDNIKDVLKTGVKGVAISSYICSSENPYKIVKELFSQYE